MMSSHEETAYKVDALNEGADVYLQKPVSPDYFLASIHSLSKRLKLAKPQQNTPTSSNTQNRWSLDHQQWQIHSPSGQTIPLSYNEYILLKALFDSPEQAMSFDETEILLGRQNCSGNDNALRVLLSRLRKKIQQHTDDVFTLKTHRQQVILSLANPS